jgi:lantibiotic modifying enzyme
MRDANQQQLLAGAERLHERVAARVSGGAEIADDQIQEILRPWARAFAAGDYEALARRLAWDHLSPRQVATALGRAGEPPVVWLDRLLALHILGEDLRALVGQHPPAASLVSEVPFAELWWPWVAAIARATWADQRTSELPRAVQTALEHDLLRDLGDLSALAALEALAAHRCGVVAPGSYQSWVEAQLGDGLASFYRSYPALLRRTGVLVETWRAAILEMAERLRGDRGSFPEAFGVAGDPGPVVEVRRLEADRHQGGRAVFAVRFASGFAVVYKPRSLRLEAVFAALVAWAGARGLVAVPPAAHVLERAQYGWMELVTPHGLDEGDAAGIARYFQRAGALVALAYLCNASDLHAENIIATARGPVVVDWEMLFQPERAPGGTPLGSCLDSGLLAAAGSEAAEAIYPGLEPVFPRRLTDRARRWRDLGGDAISVGAGDLFATPRENAPRVAGRALAPAAHADALLAGFAEGYRFLVAHRRELLAPGGLLDRGGALAGARTRVLLRRSQEYATLLGMLGLPRFQRAGLASGYLLEASLRPLASARERPPSWPLVAVEREALENLDLPRFELDVNSLAVPALGLTAAGYEEVAVGLFTRSGVEAVRARLLAAGEEDLADQLGLLRAALQRGSLTGGASLADGGLADPGKAAGGREAALILARRLAVEFQDCDALADGARIPPPDDDRVGRPPDVGVGDFSARDTLADVALYDGAAGRAVWLAACARVSGETIFDTSLGTALARVRALLDAWDRQGAPDGPVGVLNGFGSLVWALVWVARLRPAVASADGRQSALELAARAAAWLTPARLARERRWDLEGGVAGAVLALLAIFEATRNAEWLELAVRAGGELVDRQERASSGGAAWRSLGTDNEPAPMLAGYAHGAAGIARALAALSVFSGEPRFLRAVEAAHEFERGLFDRDRGNWPVLGGRGLGSSAGGAVAWMTAWCHGAPGIALGRAMLPAMLRSTLVVEEIEQAVATTIAAGLGSDDHLCCGAAGRIGVLAAVGRRLGRVDWVATAAGLGRDLLERGERRGFRLPRARLPARARRGLFRGLPGISLQLLALDADLPPLLALALPSEVAE